MKKYTIVVDLKEIKYYFVKDIIDFLENSKNENIDIYINDECIFMLDKNRTILFNDTVNIPKHLLQYINKKYLKSEDCLIRDFAFKIKSSPFCKGSIWQNGEFSYWIKSYCFFCISNQKGHLLLYNYVTHKTTRKKVSLMKN